jgi:glutamate/aspartate transport system substrate-binding protein
VAQTGGTVEKIKSSGSITLGVRESSGALAYTLGGGKYGGFHTEMANNIIADLKAALNLPALKVKYLPITSESRIPLVVDGTVDLECGSTTNDMSREKQVDFADTTYLEQVRIAVPANSSINGIRDLNGKTVVTTAGTTEVQLLHDNKEAENIQFKLLLGRDHGDSFQMLESGRADAFVMDGSILAGNIAMSKNPQAFKLVGEPLSTEPIACMLRKHDEAFLKMVNRSIERQARDGTLAKLWDKWFIQPIPPANQPVGLALSQATKFDWEHPNNKSKEAIWLQMLQQDWLRQNGKSN